MSIQGANKMEQEHTLSSLLQLLICLSACATTILLVPSAHSLSLSLSLSFAHSLSLSLSLSLSTVKYTNHTLQKK